MRTSVLSRETAGEIFIPSTRRLRAGSPCIIHELMLSLIPLGGPLRPFMLTFMVITRHYTELFYSKVCLRGHIPLFPSTKGVSYSAWRRDMLIPP